MDSHSHWLCIGSGIIWRGSSSFRDTGHVGNGQSQREELECNNEYNGNFRCRYTSPLNSCHSFSNSNGSIGNEQRFLTKVYEC